MSLRNMSGRNAAADGNSSEHAAKMRRRQCRNFEKRVSEECGGLRPLRPVSFRGRAGASRQSAGHADRMPDVAGQRNDRAGLSRHDQAACRRRISDDRTVLAGGLRRLRVRRPRQIQGAELRKILGDAGVNCVSSHFGIEELRKNQAGRDCLGERRRPDANAGAQPRRAARTRPWMT